MRPRPAPTNLGVAAVGIGLLCLVALFAPWLTGDPLRVDLDARLFAPGSQHPLGCDTLGRDVFARILHGARISLLVGTCVVTISLAIGIAVGAVAGWLGAGRIDCRRRRLR